MTALLPAIPGATKMEVITQIGRSPVVENISVSGLEKLFRLPDPKAAKLSQDYRNSMAAAQSSSFAGVASG